MAYNAPLQSLIHSTGSTSHSSLPSTANRSSTALLTPQLTALADPQTQHTVDLQLVSFVTHELIHLLLDSARTARLRQQQQQHQVDDDLADLGLDDRASAAPSQGGGAAAKGKGKDAQAGGEGAAEAQGFTDEDDEGVRSRLEQMGFKVGWATAERLAKDRPLFPSPSPAPSSSLPSSPSVPSPSSGATSVPAPHQSTDLLEHVKFLCKDVWTALYDKQVDNLRTNHRGVWVLLDGAWRPLRGVSRGGVGTSREAEREVQRWISFLLAFPTGVLRGALANLGVHNVSVTTESPGGHQASFQIKLTSPAGAAPPTPALAQGGAPSRTSLSGR
ncbi:hypothetical protein JCM8097_003423 [Rhodosporidiobolus ruineniae]